jgi:protein-S-isoprenylcysteine O-methyltransferase Ste14
MKMNWGTLIVLLVAGAYLVLAYRDEPWTPARVAGAIVGIVFGILVIVARVQLGRSFTVRAQAHSLVTSGMFLER